MTTQLVEYRKSLGLSQRKAAEICRVTTNAYGAYEKGEIANSVFTLRKIAKGLGLSMEEAAAMVRQKTTTGLVRAFPTILAGWQDLLGKTDEQIVSEIKAQSGIYIRPGNWANYKGGSGAMSVRNIREVSRLEAIANYFRGEIPKAIAGMSDAQLCDLADGLKYGQPIKDWVDAGRPFSWEFIYESIDIARRDLEISLQANASDQSSDE